MYNIRIQLVCLLLGFSATAFSNENDSTVIQTQQNEQEIFYIEDNASALYPDGHNAVETVFTADSTISIVVDTAGIKDEQVITFFSKEKKVDVVNESFDGVKSTTVDVVSKDSLSNSTLSTSHNAAPVPVEIKKHSSSVEKTDSLLATVEVGADYIVKNDQIPDRDAVVTDTVQVEDDGYEGYFPTYKRKSAYKNLEEATLASDRLLAQLKKKHLQKDQPTSKSGSLSSRVVRGGDYVRSTAKNDLGSGSGSKANSLDFDYETDFGNEPTYYINGVKVEKTEVLKLRKRNILSRTMKLKDTASRNPNGEIWIEVKE